MAILPTISGKKLMKLLEQNGFVLIRIRGSHFLFIHQDGRATVVPVHKNNDLPKGLLKKIIREELKITVEEFCTWLDNS